MTSIIKDSHLDDSLNVASITVSHSLAGTTPIFFAKDSDSEGVSSEVKEAMETILKSGLIEGILLQEDMLTIHRLENASWDKIMIKLEEALSSIPSPASKRTTEEHVLFDKVQKILDEDINPQIASHGGSISLSDVQNTTIFIVMSGGCQGCAGARATLKQGVEQIVKEKASEVTAIVDITDHNAGENPYFQ